MTDEVVLPNRAKYSAETCMLAGLYYMHRPVTQDQVADFIGISCQPNASRLISFFLDHLIFNFQHLISLDPDDSLRRWAPYVDMFKRKLRMFHVEGVDSRRYNDVIGFVDGKLHRIARPLQRPEHTAIGVDTQRTVYSGYKKVHAVKFQAVVVPNGIIVQLSGGYRGRVADSTAMRRSGLNEMLRSLSDDARQPCHVYGDAAYPILSHIRKAHGTRRVSTDVNHWIPQSLIQRQERQVLNRVRTSVEWCFNHVMHTWEGINLWQSERIFLNQPGKKFIAAVILTNFSCCLNGNLISQFFGCRAPLLETYVNM
jgi:hypothetical protein